MRKSRFNADCTVVSTANRQAMQLNSSEGSQSLEGGDDVGSPLVRITIITITMYAMVDQ